LTVITASDIIQAYPWGVKFMDWWVVALRLTGIGWYVVASILGGTLLGVFVDNKLGTSVTFTILGVLFGSLVAFYGLYRSIMPIVEALSTKKEQKKYSNK
jgi:F0F1-type ATP synthase assembly protein I